MNTLYTQPGCQPCRMSKKLLDKHNIDYVTVDISQDEAGRQAVIDLGYQSLPVLVTDTGNHWNGFAPEKIKALASV
jgi:glutaredoxin-like protein NrdH